MEQPNMAYINELSGNDEAFKQQLISIIKTEFPEELETYTTNLQNRNLKVLAENVHKIKHKISILGLEKSYEIAAQYESNLIEGNTQGEDEFKKILATITQYLKAI